jgi:hypothetical protein
MKCVIIGIAPEEGVICCLETCFQLSDTHKKAPNEELREEEEMIAILSQTLIVIH